MLPWPITWEGVALIAQSEGCRLNAYQDAVGIWTIGWGETLNVRKGMAWTQQQADEALCARLKEFAVGVLRTITNPGTTPLQLAAFVSLAYNIGEAAFGGSSALRLHNQGKYPEAAAAIKLWNKAGGKVLAGLVTRRAKEAELYLEGVPVQVVAQVDEPLDEPLDEPINPINGVPDADADCEKPLYQSTSMQAGTVTAVISGLAVATEVSRQVAGDPYSASLIPHWLIPALLCVVLAAGIVVMVRAWKRKQEGRS
jgi:lysozyme